MFMLIGTGFPTATRQNPGKWRLSLLMESLLYTSMTYPTNFCRFSNQFVLRYLVPVQILLMALSNASASSVDRWLDPVYSPLVTLSMEQRLLVSIKTLLIWMKPNPLWSGLKLKVDQHLFLTRITIFRRGIYSILQLEPSATFNNAINRASRQRLLAVAQNLSMACVPEGGMNYDWDLTYIIDGMVLHYFDVRSSILFVLYRNDNRRTCYSCASALWRRSNAVRIKRYRCNSNSHCQLRRSMGRTISMGYEWYP